MNLVDTTLSALPLLRGPSSHLVRQVVCLAQSLSQVGVVDLEVGLLDDPRRFDLFHQISCHVPEIRVMAWSPLSRKQITHTFEALKACRMPRLGLVLPWSPELSPAASWVDSPLVAQVAESVRYGRRLGGSVDLVVEDPGRFDPGFLTRAAETALESGAEGLTISETNRMSLMEFARLMMRLTSDLAGARIGVRCRNIPGVATELSLMAAEQGAAEMGTVVDTWPYGWSCPPLTNLAALGMVPIDLAALRGVALQFQVLTLPASQEFDQAAVSRFEPNGSKPAGT